MPTAGKLGRKPYDPSRPKLNLSTLYSATPTPPPSVDYLTGISYPVSLNDSLGDCVEAGQNHELQVFTTIGQRKTVTLSDADVEKLYSAEGGYVPGDPSTDQGTVVADALSYWRKTGINGDKIVAYASVNVTDANEVAAAIDEFGPVMIGFNVYQATMDQFNDGKPWDATKSPGELLGGHCVIVGAYDATTKKAVTWGAIQELTDDFWTWKVNGQPVVEEAWVIVTQDWINKVSGTTPTGLDLAAFGAEYAALTGEPNPFPDAPPTPEPTPTPVPSPPDPNPVPVPPGPPVPPTPTPEPPDQVDESLAPLLYKLIRHRWHHITSKDIALMDNWLEAKDL